MYFKLLLVYNNKQNISDNHTFFIHFWLLKYYLFFRWLFPTSFILLNIVYWALFGDHDLWWSLVNISVIIPFDHDFTDNSVLSSVIMNILKVIILNCELSHSDQSLLWTQLHCDHSVSWTALQWSICIGTIIVIILYCDYTHSDNSVSWTLSQWLSVFGTHL